MLLILALAASGLSTAAQARHIAKGQTSLNWQPCPELNANISKILTPDRPFDCATLSVPLDYTNPNSEKLDLSLFKVNATQEPVLGTVLINFGGPGGTGAENLPAWADEMAANIGPQWDLLSWDPRGTGYTLPFNCSSGTASSAPNKRKRDTTMDKHKRDSADFIAPNVTEYLLNTGWDDAGAQADLCYAAMNGTGQLIGSAFVARDMMQIVDALNEDGMLRYYGWSYGTALGSYVAAMFPERVERIVLDANVNPHDYQAGHYGDFLVDADKTFTAFLQECLNNKDDCALAQYTNATTIDDMVKVLNAALQPIVANATTDAQSWLLYTLTEMPIFSDLYFPKSWPTLATTITTMLNGTYTAAPPPDFTYGKAAEAAYGIRGSDALWHPATAEEYLPQAQYQESISSWKFNYPPLWISAQWKMPCKEQYKGDFNVKTKHPILYVNGEYDPVTPLVNAYNATHSFQGSVVLQHSGYGHGSVADPSKCVQQHIQAYFKDGTLPPTGTHCEPDLGPWQYAASQAGNGGSGDNNSTSQPSATPTPFPGAATTNGVKVGFALTAILAVLGINLL